MKHITFYLDFVSPYAYLAFERLPQEMAGLSYGVTYAPVLLGALLQHHGNSAPADTPAKRAWLYRHVSWLGQQQEPTFSMPRVHPFNPLPLLRLALACAADGQPNRHVCGEIFRHVWLGGEDAADPARLTALQARLQPVRDHAGADVKQQLRETTAAAAQAGVFGVPTFALDGKLFWGLDALPMLRACAEGDAWFDGPQWQTAADRPAMGSGKPPAGPT